MRMQTRMSTCKADLGIHSCKQNTDKHRHTHTHITHIKAYIGAKHMQLLYTQCMAAGIRVSTQTGAYVYDMSKSAHTTHE